VKETFDPVALSNPRKVLPSLEESAKKEAYV
jgi:hypothetical protein